MENRAISKTLRLLSQLMELHDENPFKIKSLANAAFKINKLPYPIASKALDEIEKIESLGKSTASKIWALIHNNPIPELDDLISRTPPGIVEMMNIKGLGPKKIYSLWKEMGIENPGELYYACNENRLMKAKGFGQKSQEEIRKSIEFNISSQGRFLYARLEIFAEELLSILRSNLRTESICLTGEFRRKAEIIDRLDYLIDVTPDELKPFLEQSGLNVTALNQTSIEAETEAGLKLKFFHSNSADWGWSLIETTGSREHVTFLNSMLGSHDPAGLTEEQIYTKAGLAFIEPELREFTTEFELAKTNSIPKLIEFADIKGSLHNHSTWSDGVHTVEEMALFCRDELRLQYLGISDHSKSAFYANGLDEIRIAAQQREIDELNIRLAPFRIFKGVESDILYDGSLDYSDEVLASFDFVVASVHSNLKMNEEKATDRLIKAIENPYTTILGHPTGRMLLSRSGYPVNHRMIIDACAANNVIIEINSNPLRLDMDWRWHRYAIEKGVLLTVNPDAHSTRGLLDMRFGIFTARKGGVSRANCLNTMNLNEVSNIFAAKKQQI